MRNMLLGGKFLAIESGDDAIGLNHLRMALSSLQPTQTEQYALLCNTLNIPADATKTERFSTQQLDDTAAKPRLPYAPDVVAVLDSLKLKGLDISCPVTEPYVNLGERKGRYHSVVAAVAELRALLTSQVFDQDDAVEAVSDAVMRMGWSELSDRPQAIFSFLGPPATGKTYMAQLLNQGLQGYALKSFDMTQYNSEKESFGLVGLRKGFTDASEGHLTGFVKQNPKSILVFDEIEKSHSRVQTALLRMLSEGRLRDEFSGEEIDFRNTIVVFTSNLGSSLYSNRTFTELTKKNPHQARENLLQAIRQEKKVEDGHQVAAIPPEMVSRLAQGSIILFHKLSIEGLSRIAKAQILRDKKAFENKLGLSVTLNDEAAITQLLVLTFAPDFDTRALKSRLTDLVYDPITDYLLQNSNAELNKVELSLSPEAGEFLSGLDLIKLPTQLATKHQKIYFDHEIREDNGTLHVTYTGARIEKLAKSDDFGDASGIQVDLPDVSFDDIAGHTLIKSRLKEAINLVKNREALKAEGVSAPRGMLLYGVPGTGKTMLAKAFAHEADLPFIACSGNDLLSESFIRTLFARARDYAPAIIFIDEIDALPRRGTAGPQADALVNRMLVEIDGFGGGESEIFIIAATNRKDLIDDAILRSGRIDLHYEVPQLDKGARRWFIEKMLKRPLFSNDVNVDQLVLLTAGFSGADLQKVSREAVLHALREGLDQITPEQLIEQINTQKYGSPLNLEDGKQHLLETAYHEAAHAVVSKLLLPERRIEQVTVVARADFLGMVSYDRDQQHDYTKEFLFNLTCVALAGRAAQVKQFGDKGLDSGASNDLKQAASYAWYAIAEWGMDDELYNICIPALQQSLGTTPFQQLTEQRIKHWLDRATAHTQAVIDTHWSKIEAVAQQVLQDEIVDATALQTLMELH